MFKINLQNNKTKLCVGLVIVCLILYLIPYFFVIAKSNEQDNTYSDAILVLGAKAYKSKDLYNPCLVARVEKGISLLNLGNSKRIIFSGGTDKEDNVNEADIMRKIAIDNGVNTDLIILENKSTSTYENLLYTKEIMKQEGITTITIVSEPFHMARVDLIANKLGINHKLVSANNSPCWKPWTFFSLGTLREPFALYGYLFQGKI